MKRDFGLVIPARLKSTRLPRKMLIEIDGKTIIQRSYECAYKSIQDRDKIIVATDSYEIKNICDRFGAKTILTSESCMTGTDRVAEVSEKIDSDSETVFHNGPNYQWRKTSNRSWNTREIDVLDYGYSNVDFETININRESLNVIRAIGWDI